MYRLSRILSTVFAPLLMPTYGMMLASHLSILAILPGRMLWATILVVFLITCVMPGIGIMALHRMGMIKDVALNERSERTVPYVLAILCYIGCAFFLWRAAAPMWLIMFIAGGAAAIAVNVVVTHWWKISAHAAGAGGIVAMLMRLSTAHQAIYCLNIWISAAVLAAGMVMTARVYLGRHTLLQVLAGVLNGFLCVWFISAIR